MSQPPPRPPPSKEAEDLALALRLSAASFRDEGRLPHSESASGGMSSGGDLMGFESRAEAAREEKLRRLQDLLASAPAPVKRSQTEGNLGRPQGLSLDPPVWAPLRGSFRAHQHVASTPQTVVQDTPVSVVSEPPDLGSPEARPFSRRAIRWRLPSGSSAGSLPLCLPFRYSGVPDGDLIDLRDPEAETPSADAWVEFDPLALSPSFEEEAQLRKLRALGRLQLQNPAFRDEEDDMGKVLSVVCRRAIEEQEAKDKRRSAAAEQPNEDHLVVEPKASTSLQAQLDLMEADIRASLVDDGWSSLILSPEVPFCRKGEGSIKVRVTLDDDIASADRRSLTFTCSIGSDVFQVLATALSSLLPNEADFGGFVLMVEGRSEFLEGSRKLSDFVHVHRVISVGHDVRLCLARRPTKVEPESAVALRRQESSQSAELGQILGAIRVELRKLRAAALDGGKTSRGRPVEQSVKLLTASLGSVCPPDLFQAVDRYKAAVIQVPSPLKRSTPTPTLLQVEEEKTSRLRLSELRPEEPSLSKPSPALLDQLETAASGLVREVQAFLGAYAASADTDWEPGPLPGEPARPPPIELGSVQELLTLKLDAVFSPKADWSGRYEALRLSCFLIHGSRNLDKARRPKQGKAAFATHFRELALFDQWIQFEQPLTILPREAVFWCVLYGYAKAPAPAQSQGGTGQGSNDCLMTQLGWAHLPLFDHQGLLVEGSVFLPLNESHELRPFGPRAFLPADRLAPPVISVTFPRFASRVFFPPVEAGNEDLRQSRCFADLDEDLQAELGDLLERGSSALAEDDAELVWEKRAYLRHLPEALPLVLAATGLCPAVDWTWAALPNLHRLLSHWAPLPPAVAVQLLQVDFPDAAVRAAGVGWVAPSAASFLPQLVEALRYEADVDCALSRALLAAAAARRRTAFALFWELQQRLSEPSAYGLRCGRLQSLLCRLLGSAFAAETAAQLRLVAALDALARRIKDLPNERPMRMATLRGALSALDGELLGAHVRLPVSPSVVACGVEVESCSYFPTNSLPLKLNFRTTRSKEPFGVLHKLGDDLRQDALVMQMVGLMKDIWLEAGLDLQIVLFDLLPTGRDRGMVQLVPDCSTLREIQVEMKGLTGAFDSTLLHRWLQKQCADELIHARAVRNFVESCAGWCVGTWVLGIGDRHNDNILVTRSGHLFHIDFGKYLGDWQMVGGVRRDRAPFFLTPEMVFVINGGKAQTENFQVFVDKACEAFNLLRRRHRLFLNLLNLMVCSGMAGLRRDAVGWIERRLFLNQTDAEARAHFTEQIRQALDDVSTTWNNFFHTIAQFRAGNFGEGENPDKLSLTDQIYTLNMDGRISRLQVLGCEKWRPEDGKKYMYKICVEREGSTVPSLIYRSFNEILELYRKLSNKYQRELSGVNPLQTTLVERNVRGVAERRRVDVGAFFGSVISGCPEASASGLFYTFFHSLLRDEDPAAQHRVTAQTDNGPTPSGSRAAVVKGELRLCVGWRRGGGGRTGGTLAVLVSHARGLADAPLPPDPYVKCYLRPSNSAMVGQSCGGGGRYTKRKTRIVKRSSHPVFNDLLEYHNMRLEELRGLELEACVWHHASASQNTLLGGVKVDLKTVADATDNSLEGWYPLQNITR